MKTKLLNQKKIVSISMLLIVIFSASLISDVYGQIVTCGPVTKSITGAGCSKKAAANSLQDRISLAAQTACIPGDSSCYPIHCLIQRVRNAGPMSCTQVPDSTCPRGVRWVCTRFVRYECMCSPARLSSESLFEDELWTRDGLLIYPNPASTSISFIMNGVEGEFQLQVINALGQTVITKSIEIMSEEAFSIDVTSLAEGIYKIVLRNDSEVSVGTFVKN